MTRFPDSIGVAVIGCGLIGRKRVAALPPGCRVVALADSDRARAEALAATLPYPARVGASASEVLGGGDVGLAIVATIHAALAPITLEALSAGCDVLVEKPGARCAAEAADLVAAASAAGHQVRVGFNHRFHPALLRAHELVGDGGHGKLLSVRARYGHGGRPGYEREWRAERALSGGGELVDQGMHLIDLTRFLVGDVDLVFSEVRTDFWPMEVEDNAYLALRPRAGGFAWLHASWTEWKNLFSLEVALERAKIEVSGLGGSYGTERLALYEMLPEMGPPRTTIWEWPQADRSWELETADVLATLGGSASLGADVQDCLAAWTVVEEAYRR
ncbi:MAG TPA: Gfo/Idh/MocA family oxidoreductase [Actinomycetota bacterium]|nr:Gfo/Idh/MocA family oxidoreductase [Actinomycetota bacterium]